MTVKISIINNKGGVGKTTSTIILSELLAYVGKRVLCIDLDSQSNLSLAFHSFDEDNEDVLRGRIAPKKENVAELFKYRYSKKEEVINLIRKTNVDRVDIIPSSIRHQRTALDIYTNTGNNNIILKKALRTLDEDYDYILIDNAPANDVLTVNSIFASDYILVPVRVENFSYKGLRETLNNILYIKDEHDINYVEFLGTFITQANVITNAFKARKELYINELGDRFFKTAIRNDTKIEQIESKMVPLITYSCGSNALIDYANLLLEMKILDNEANKILEMSLNQ